MNQLFQNPGFLIHLSVYIAVNLFLIALNVWQSPNEIWFIWPLIGWGIGVMGHAAGIVLSGRSRRRPA
jgi:hypothetical protein